MELRGRRGYLLLLVVLLAAALMFLSTVLLRYVDGNRQLASRLEREWVAEAAAEAGLERSRRELARNSDWQQGFQDLVQPASQGHCLVTFKAGAAPHSTTNVRGRSAVTGFGGREVPPGFVHLVATGYDGPHTFVAEALICVTGELLYSDFESDHAGWTESRGTQFTLVNGTYQVGGTSPHTTVAGSLNWRDYHLEARARRVAGTGEFALSARGQWDGRGLEFRYSPQADSFAFQQGQETPVVLARAQTLLARLSPRWSDDFHLYRVEVLGDRALCKVDGQLIFDQPIGAGQTHGRVGLGTGQDASWAVDEARVSVGQKVQYTARW